MINKLKNNLRLFLLTVIILISFVDKSFSQITGSVLDEKSGNPLPSVNIVLLGTTIGTTSDSKGYYSIQKVPPGTYTIAASMIGYNQEKIDSVTVTKEDSVYIVFKMKERIFLLKDIIVTPGHYSLMENKSTSSSGLVASNLRNFPKLGEDIYRAVTNLPGISSNDYSAKFYIRGGEQDEVLTLLDGMELPDPFHLKDFGGALSAIDVEVISKIDMITGAFPAEYGDRLSGVFNITTKTPETEKPKTFLALSFMNARLLTEGSADNGKFFWQVLARKGYIDLILDLIKEDDSYRPSYYDILGKVQYFLNSNQEISAHFLLSHDKLTGSENDLEDPLNDENLNNKYGSFTSWLNWNAQFNTGLFVQTVLFTGSTFDDKLSQGYYNNILEYEASDKHSYNYFGLKQNWDYEFTDRYLLKCGFHIKTYNAGYDYYYTNINWEQNNTYSRRDVNIDPNGTELGLYVANRFQVSNPITVELGIRYQQASWTGDKNWNPRINIAYKLGNRTTIRAGWGMFNQVHAIDQLNMVDDDYTYYPAELSRHLVAGLEHQFLDGTNVRIEGYYKFLSDIRPRYISYRYNTDTSPENSHDRIRIEADGGKSTGIEVYFNNSSWKQFKWWLSYSYSIAENTINRENVPCEMDQRHTINIDLCYQPDENWAFSISWNYHSGWPYTEETVNIIEQNPNGSYHWAWAPGKLYGKRFPPYHRMDIRVSRYFETSLGLISLFVEVRNLYNRKNIRQYDYSDVKIHSLNSYSYTKTPREWLPLIPSFGISWEF